MRILSAIFVSLLLSAVGFGQMPAPDGVRYVYAPYVPMVTTPQVSLQTVSPNSVGAGNATNGLQAGARNSTSSTLTVDTSSSYTEPVWYSGGGAPLISSPQVSLFPRSLHGEHMRMHRGEEERGEEHAQEARAWTYFASEEETSNAVEAATAAKSAKHAARTYTNQDVENENQKNGMVKYDSKSEKIQ